ncbi:ABC transporter ATP-binding protein [Myxococcota bacterium]|nr:ABC transporter ATP-binding protein [Myxococcota bacterium]
MTPIVEVRDLRREFGHVRAIDGMSFTLNAGAPIGLVGPNGAGKTTLFSVLCGFLPPTSGDVKVMGRPPLHPDLRGRVAILPQDAALVKGMPIVRQLALFAELQGFDRAGAIREAERVLGLVELADVGGRAVDTLSHGMRKRVAIAQAFIGEPELVLLDEPTAGLDPNTATNIANLIRSLDQSRTFIISSHNLDDIEALCGSVVIISQGRLTEHRTLGELMARTSVLTFRLEAEASGEAIAALQTVEGVTKVERGTDGERRLVVHFRESDANATQIRVLQALAQAGVVFLEMQRGQSLESRVRELTRR